jgi:carbonic anhydrase/acetyltransferase-like protein (isoleucine patch superfamily)
MSMRLVRGVYLADGVHVIGDVTIGRDSNIWFGSVVRGDVAPIRIGHTVNIQDNCTIHCDDDIPNVLGDRVTLAHGVIAHGCEIGDGSLIGIGATLLAGSKIGRNCLVAAGAVVPPNLVVPDGMVVMGLPGRVVRETSAREKAYIAMVPDRYLRLAKVHHEQPEDPRVRPWA